jgi:hypothetical protein
MNIKNCASFVLLTTRCPSIRRETIPLYYTISEHPLHLYSFISRGYLKWLFSFTSLVKFKVSDQDPPSKWPLKRSSTLTFLIWLATAVTWGLECGSEKIIFRDHLFIVDNGNRIPEDNSKNKDSLEYYLWLAKLAEKGKIARIFFADTYGVHDT